MSKQPLYDVLVIGAGPTGLACAIDAQNVGCSVGGAGETRGPCADDEDVVKSLFTHDSDCMDERKGRKDAAPRSVH